jgi:rubrerythrin
MRIKDTGEEIQVYDFNAVESFKIARKLEKEGIDFYKKLLGTIKDPKVKEVLIYLLNEENDHLQLFEKMIESEDPEALDDSEEDILDIVDTGVFTLPKDKELAADLDKALQFGINIEKKSLAFYLEIMKYTEREEGKNALKKIIGEEKKHWEELKRLTQ